MNSGLYHLKKLLSEMYRFEDADLDYGIHRLMNRERQGIARYIERNLREAARATLDTARIFGAGRAPMDFETPTTPQCVISGVHCLVPTPDDLAAPIIEEEFPGLEDEIFRHLHEFLRRLRVGWGPPGTGILRGGTVAVPRADKSIGITWSHHDQYYVKISDARRGYAFRLPSGRRVHFRVAPRRTDGLEFTSRLRFSLDEHRPVDAEGDDLFITFIHHSKSGRVTQKSLNELAVESILAHGDAKDWVEELSAPARTESNRHRSILEKHVAAYAVRDSFDRFLHKDLAEFLHREMDAYIQNEILRLEELERDLAGAARTGRKAKSFRRIAREIVSPLARMEDLQKRIWLKKKFVVETNYCVTLDRIPRRLYEQIAANNPQREEWVRLFAIDTLSGPEVPMRYSEPLTPAFLEANPFLLVDTRFFDREFKEALLSSFEDIDGQTDGLLIHGENFQALQLLSDTVRARIDAVVIDPPYNTGFGAWSYDDAYSSSAWISFLRDRLQLSRPMLRPGGSLFVHIGNEEVAHLRQLLDLTWGCDCFKSAIVIRRGSKNVQAQFETIDSLVHGYEYVLHYSRTAEARFRKLLLPGPAGNGDGPVPAGKWNNHWRGTDRPTMRYELFGTVPRWGQWRWGKDRSLAAAACYERMRAEIGTHPGQREIDSWVRREWMRTGLRPDLLRLSSTGKPEHYVPPSEGKLASDLWIDLKPNGPSRLKNIMGDRTFQTPKSVDLVKRIVKFQLPSGRGRVLDYFAGSGTTAEAIIELNREDGGQRKYILVELGGCFDSVLKPRICRIIHTPKWKDGKPMNRKGSSHLLKYIRLESYEDALNSLEPAFSGHEKTFASLSPSNGERSGLYYGANPEDPVHPCFLNVKEFEDPYGYTLKAGSGDPLSVDLVETFNLLLGLSVKRMEVDRGFLTVEGTGPDGGRVLVVWRNVRESKGEELRGFFRTHCPGRDDESFSAIYVNAMNRLEMEKVRKSGVTARIRSIEETFRQLMFDGREVR